MQQHCTVLPDLDHLNNYFVSVGQILSSKLPTIENNAKIANNKETMFVYPTDEFEVAKILKNMKNKKSTGEDGISNEMLKCCSPMIEPHIATLFNNCIEDGIFPDCFKTAKVIPLYKKGDRKDPGNYRPISLLSSLSKIFEKLLHKRMMNFCESNNLLHGAQFGFRSKMSCVHAITTVTEYIRTAIENKQLGQSCFIDLQKAFDTLNHEILLQKMENYGFRGKILSLIASFLKDRRQFVYHNGRTTSKRLITTGVPQGSVLGPFLFLLYINDLPTIIQESQVTMFADDTSLLKSGKKGELLLQPDVERLSNWFISNKLTINVGKCEIISFGIGAPQEPHILEKPLTYKKSCKYLGLHLDGSLRFREHIDYVVKKLNKFVA